MRYEDRIISEAGLFALVGALVRITVADYRDPTYTPRRGHGSPREALLRWGLLDPVTGELDPRFGSPRRRQRAIRDPQPQKEPTQ